MTDLFHAITQGIDSILTCHYFDTFKESNISRSASRSSSRGTSRRNSMSDKMMDTEPGGENTQQVTKCGNASFVSTDASSTDMSPSKP